MLSRLNSAVSVRARLIVLSLIPVIGFAAVVFAYLSSERAVEAAFASVQQSARLAETSRAFKDALVAMQTSAKEFVAQPQPSFASRFDQAQEAAITALKTLQDLVGESEKPTLVGLQGRVVNLKST